jgi:hypothetical protein
MSDDSPLKIDIDRELDGMRRIDAAVLSRLFLPSDKPRRVGRLSFQVRVLSSGLRGAMRRLVRRGYIEPGRKLTHDDSATFQVTELGKRVAPAAALAIEAEAMDFDGTVQPFWCRFQRSSRASGHRRRSSRRALADRAERQCVASPSQAELARGVGSRRRDRWRS